jgi:hypothetical protein
VQFVSHEGTKENKIIRPMRIPDLFVFAPLISVRVEPFGWLAAAQDKLGQRPVETPIKRAQPHGVSTGLDTNGIGGSS